MQYFVLFCYFCKILSTLNKVVLIARYNDCPFLDSVITNLKLSNNKFNIIYTDDDVVIDRYIKKEYKHKCPLIFTDNILRGSGHDFMMAIDRRNVFNEWY